MGGMQEMKQLVVRCSIPPLDAASFPPLAVARKLIHTHTSSPFPHACSHLQHLLHDGHAGSFQGLAMGAHIPFSPSPPPLIINHACPASPDITLQQQVSLQDATPSPTKAASASPHCHESCHIRDSTNLVTDSGRYPFSSPSFVEEQVPSPSQDNNLPSPLTLPHSRVSPRSPVSPHSQVSPLMSPHSRGSPDGLLPSTSKHTEKISHKPSRHSILSSLLAAAEDGAALAAELLHHLKESLLSTLPQSIRSKVSNDWESIISSRVLEQYMDKMNSSLHSPAPLWLTNTSKFKRVIKKVSQIKPTHALHRHHSIEDLLRTIESFERAGLIDEIRSLGFVEEASILQDRIVLYGLFARLRVLQEVSNLLYYMRSEMHLPLQDTWSLACSDARYRNCLKQICIVCDFPDKIKTFAWKLDKLELCANEADSCKMYQGPNASGIDNRLTKLLDSPLGLELEALRVVSHLDTAVSLLLNHIDVLESLREHGFGDT